ncbi:uncharacterized protein LOC132884883 isoform X4 [Neoarius graeffei]|uniref:uncharacterized protein LOC132884883 isoform X4 n=1 Tax=Neoarius graeffei TaxID=443677 RepID=UPI00298C492C|nr:uncharacterized protein LOC132884883 isoform X4 [Neoarius graeffei]
MSTRQETEKDFIQEDVEDVFSLNLDPGTPPTECLCCNGEDQHTERTLLKMCTVRLVDFRKIEGLRAKILSEGILLTGVSDESSMFDGDQKPLQAQLKMNSLSPEVDCGKIAVDQPEGGAFYHKYKHSNFISSSTDQCILGTSHKMCYFGDARTQSSSHHSLALVKVTQILTLAHFSCFQHIDIDCSLAT